MAEVKVTVLGSSGTHPSRGRVCASYLLESGGARLLLDCGNGSLANLTRVCDVADLDGLALSHLHPDHFADLYGLLYALRFHPNGPEPLDVYARPGARAHIGRLLDEVSDLDVSFRFHEVAGGDGFGVGPFTVSLFPAAHPVEAVAMRVTVSGRVIAYSGDSGPSPDVVACAREADLFICDASWLEDAGPYPAEVHMTGAQAGQHAQRAGALRLLITHVFPTNDPDEVATEASRHFDGEILVATDMAELRL